MGLKFSNFAKSTIADVGGIASGDTTVNVAPGDGALFPSLAAGDYFYCTLIDTSGNREVVKCTARATDTLTIARSQDGTTARSFDFGDVISHRLNKSALDEFLSVADDVTTDLATHLSSSLHIPAGTIMLFGQNTAPTGWTRKTNWQDNAMLCYAATGNIGSGGAINPQGAHSHTIANHTHTGPNHLHTTAAHKLSTAEMPIHDHVVSTHYGLAAASLSGGTNVWQYTTGTLTTAPAGGDGYHEHGNTGYAGTGTTSSSGPGATAGNSTPFYQEVIACTKN
jgi:hypothetical protein